jgi:hypothetical protein
MHVAHERRGIRHAVERADAKGMVEGSVTKGKRPVESARKNWTREPRRPPAFVSARRSIAEAKSSPTTSNPERARATE